MWAICLEGVGGQRIRTPTGEEIIALPRDIPACYIKAQSGDPFGAGLSVYTARFVRTEECELIDGQLCTIYRQDGPATKEDQ